MLLIYFYSCWLCIWFKSSAQVLFGIINYLGIDIKHHESMEVRHWRPLIMLLIYIYSCWLCIWFKSSAQVLFGIINYLGIDIKMKWAFHFGQNKMFISIWLKWTVHFGQNEFGHHTTKPIPSLYLAPQSLLISWSQHLGQIWS